MRANPDRNSEAAAATRKRGISRTSLVVSAFDDTSHRGCRSDEHIVLIDRIEAGDIPGAIASIEAHLAEIEASITAKPQQNADGYHPLQYLFRDEKAGEG